MSLLLGRCILLNYNIITLWCIVEPPSWNPWSSWGDCDCFDGMGEQERTRTCNDPLPDDNNDCLGNPIEYQECDDECASKYTIAIYIRSIRCFSALSKILLKIVTLILTLQPRNFSVGIFNHLKLCLADAIHNFQVSEKYSF